MWFLSFVVDPLLQPIKCTLVKNLIHDKQHGVQNIYVKVNDEQRILQDEDRRQSMALIND